MGKRARKVKFISVVKAYVLAQKLTPEQGARFELMLHRAKSFQEQEAVANAVRNVAIGYTTGGDAYSKILRAANDIDDILDSDEPEDPPALKAALERSQVTFLRKSR